MDNLIMYRCDGSHPDFISLVELLDKELTIIDGDDHDFYHQFNGIADISHAVVLYKNELPVACGAIKKFSDTVMEIKRMFVLNSYRKQGLSTFILEELEKWAKELKAHKIILETGKRQKAAIGLYKKHGFEVTDNYPPYVGVENSVCFKKDIDCLLMQDSF